MSVALSISPFISLSLCIHISLIHSFLSFPLPLHPSFFPCISVSLSLSPLSLSFAISHTPSFFSVIYIYIYIYISSLLSVCLCFHSLFLHSFVLLFIFPSFSSLPIFLYFSLHLLPLFLLSLYSSMYLSSYFSLSLFLSVSASISIFLSFSLPSFSLPLLNISSIFCLSTLTRRYTKKLSRQR